MKNILEKMELIEKNIQSEKEMIENYEKENNQYQNQIWDYENDLNEDWGSEIDDLIDSMVINENLIKRCESEIEIYEEELKIEIKYEQISDFRDYLIETIRVNKNLFNELNNSDWEELGYSSEEDMESVCSRYGGIFHSTECILETFDNFFINN